MRIWAALCTLMFGLGLAFAAQAQGISDETRAQIAKTPQSFLDKASMAIAFFGDARGLNQSAVEDIIAAERAIRRADVLQLLLSADLSADGAVSDAEVARIAPSLSANARGKLFARHATADADGDGLATGAELQDYAAAEAMRLVPPKRQADLLLLLIFDTNADGWVTFAEIQKAVADIAT
jgi:hypothetical protein